MWTPDRSPHPSVREIKFLQQPVLIRPAHCHVNGEVLLDLCSDGSISLTFNFENRYTFRQLDHIEWTWTFTTNRSPSVIISRKFTIADSNREGVFNIQVDGAAASAMQTIADTPNDGVSKFWINFTGSIKEKCEWAPSGHQLVGFQYPLKVAPSPHDNRGPTGRTSNQWWSKPTFETAGNAVLVHYETAPGKRCLLASLNSVSGGLTSYSPLGRNFLKEESIPSFCRAFTDNDRGGMELTLDMMFPEWCYNIYWLVRGTADFSYASHWKLHGLDPYSPPTISCVRVVPMEGSWRDRVSIDLMCNVTSRKCKSILFTVELRYDFYGDGRIRISQK